jgi:hypothetical protein
VFYLFGSKKEEREFLVGSLAVLLFWVSSVSNTTRCSRDAWLKHSVVLSKRQSFRTVVFSIIFFFVYFRIQNDEKTGFDGRREVSTKSARS